MLNICVCVFFLNLKDLEPGGRPRGGRAEETKENRGNEKMMDAQVLLLIDPGAVLGWAVLSDTLPSCEAGDVCARA